MLKDLKIDQDLSKEVRDYMLHIQDNKRRRTYTVLLNDLSTNLQMKMACSNTFNARINSVYFMSGFKPIVVLQIFKCLEGHIHAPNELLHRPQTLHIVVSDGIVVQKNKIYTMNASFDHDFICYGLDPLKHRYRAAKARTFVEVDTLTQEDFYNIVDNSLDVSDADKKKIRLARVRFSLLDYAMHYRGKKDHKLVNDKEKLHVKRVDSGADLSETYSGEYQASTDANERTSPEEVTEDGEDARGAARKGDTGLLLQTDVGQNEGVPDTWSSRFCDAVYESK